MDAKLQELSDKIDNLQTELNAKQTQITNAINDLKNAVINPADVDSLIEKVNKVTDDLQSTPLDGTADTD